MVDIQSTGECVSPKSEDWNDSYVDEKVDCQNDGEIVVSDDSEHEESGPEYFTNLIDQSANDNLFDPSCNVDTSTLNDRELSQCNGENVTTDDLKHTDTKESLFGVKQLSLGVDNVVTTVDINTPRDKCNDVCNTGNDNVSSQKTSECNHVIPEVNNKVKDNEKVVTSKSVTDVKVNSSVVNKKDELSDESARSKKNNETKNKLLWVPKGTTPIYMSKSEESRRRIESARMKAKATSNDVKNKNPGLVKDEFTDVEAIRSKIAANAKAAAEAKAAIVLKEKQRVKEANKARKEAREKYIKEARDHLDSLKAVNRSNRIPNVKSNTTTVTK